MNFSMSKIYFFLLFCLSCLHSILAQPFTPLHTIENIDCQSFTTDALYNIYVVTNENELIRYDTLGNITGRFSDKKSGHLKAVEVGNPFQIMLYYDDFQQITLLDKQLTILGKYRLYDAGVQQLTALTVSDRYDLWLYDAGDATLKKWQIGVSEATSNHQTLLLRKPPTWMCVQENILYLKTPTGIQTYDIFGQFIADWEVKMGENGQIFENNLYFIEDIFFIKYNSTIRLKKSVPLPENAQGATAFRIEKNKLFVLNKNRIQIYGY
jgi:hypothetical protein